tara:strand:+ start:1004 stop:1348 length:345 start_codon:yes stop_codon:yes gene_type:complete
MESLYYTLFYRFIIGGVILSGSTWLANNSNPLLAGILITIPLELVSLFFVHENRLRSYAYSILIMSIATVIPVLYYNLILPMNILKYPFDVCSSFIVWLLVGIILYLYVPKTIV